MKPLVSVTIVTYNNLKYIPKCLDSLFAADYSPFEVIIVDNNSTDGSREFFERTTYPVQVQYNSSNLGFSFAQNKAIRCAKGEWVLCLNPDTRLTPNCVSELVRAGELSPNLGIVCPKILCMEAESGDISNPGRLDSAGMYFNRWLRHHDRGSQQVDKGQYEIPEYVFGYTGAVVLFRRTMIEDVSVDGEFMDEDFFLYREDADLSWRAQLLGWRCIYTPYAVAYHVRRVVGDKRRGLPPFINMHSTKNRFLMRIKNITWGVYRKVLIPTTLRDLGILCYVLLREWGSLPGLWYIVRNWKRMWEKRRGIQARRRIRDEDIARWFQDSPIAFPLEPELRDRLSAKAGC